MSASAASLESQGDFLTIDELAARTGTTVRNIRFYATSGLLPPPKRTGRIAYYSTAHRLRLDFIAELQQHGYTLAGIEKVLRRIPIDASASEFAIHRAMLAPWAPDTYDELSRVELERRAGRPLSDEELEFFLDLGIIEKLDDDLYRTTARGLSGGVEILSVKVPLSVMHSAAKVIRDHATAAAEELSDVFKRGIWDPYRKGELDEIPGDDLAAAIAQLRPLTVQGLVAAFERAVDRTIQRP